MLSIQTSVGGHLGCSHLLSIVNNTAVNIGIQYLFESLLSVPLGKYLEMAGSYVNSTLIFLGAAKLFSAAAAAFYTHQQCTRVPISPHPHQYLFPFFLT